MSKLQSAGEAAYVRGCLDEAVSLVAAHPGRWVSACAWRYTAFWLGRPEWWRAPRSSAAPRAGLRALATTGLAAARGAMVLLPALVGWAGIVLGRWRASARLLGVLLAAYAVSYALTHVEARYRLPIEPALLAAAAAGWRWRRNVAQRGPTSSRTSSSIPSSGTGAGPPASRVTLKPHFSRMRSEATFWRLTRAWSGRVFVPAR